MGWFDGLFEQQKPQGGLLSDPQALLALAGPLLSARKGDNSMAMAVNQGLTTHRANVADERANRQNELSQISGTYKILKDLDNQAMLQAQMEGRQHIPNPQLAAMESRLSELTGQTPMTRTNVPAQQPQQPQQIPAPIASQSLLAVRPELRQPLPDQGQQGPQGAPQAQGQQPSLGQLAEMAGVPKPVAFGLIAANKPDKLMELIAKGFEMKGSGGNFVRLSPKTGGMEFLGGQMQPNSFPVTSNGQGGLTVSPVSGLNEAIAEQTKARVTAEKSAAAPFEFQEYTMPDGRKVKLSNEQFRQQLGYPNVTPQQQQARDGQRMQILLAERDALAKQGKTDPALEKEIGLAQKGQNFADQRPMITGPTTAQHVASETNPKLQVEYLAKSFEENSKTNDALQFMEAGRNAIKSGAFTGALAKPQLLVARYGAAFGIPTDAKVADTETFMAMAGRQVMGVIKSLGSGSGISDADREYAASAMGGSTKLNEQSILRLMDIQEKAIRRGIDLHNQKIDQASANGVPSVFDYKIQPYGKAPAQTPSGGAVRRYNPASGKIE